MRHQSTNISRSLNLLQSDYHVLYQKLRSYHWQVTGPLFFTLHAQFETLYNAAAQHGDAVAERTLTLGGKPVATLAEQLRLARLQEDAAARPAEEMVRALCSDYETLNDAIRDLSHQAAEQNDVATVNLLDEIAAEQEKTVWMLRAFLSESVSSSARQRIPAEAA